MTLEEIEIKIREYLIIYKDDEKAVKFLTLFLECVVNAPRELDLIVKRY